MFMVGQAYVVYNNKRKRITMKPKSNIISRRQKIIKDFIKNQGMATPMDIANHICKNMKEYKHRDIFVIYSNIFSDLKEIGAVKVFGYVLSTTIIKITPK